MTSARIWRWTLPYLSFLRIAREASCKVRWALSSLKWDLCQCGKECVVGQLVNPTVARLQIALQPIYIAEV
jgi:hypothetical protein